MATINQNNVSEYIKSGLIDPTKIKIDLNRNKTTSDPNHKWITLDNAIKQGLDFNFDYDVKEIETPTTLPEVVVTKPKLVPKKKINFNITPEQLEEQKENEPHWYDYATRNFENTFGVSPRSVADWIPGVGDVLALGDIKQSLDEGNYGEAALAAGFMLVPNSIEKPIRKATKWIPQSDFAKKLVKQYETTPDENKAKYFEKILDQIASLEGRIEAINFAKRLIQMLNFQKEPLNRFMVKELPQILKEQIFLLEMQIIQADTMTLKQILFL